MKIIGEAIFAKNDQGVLKSRIGTMFFRTPGMVTKRGIHAMQRVMWIEELNRLRAEQGLAAMTPGEEDEEMSESVDLIFTDELVLIRPDPDRMDLAFRADEVLQTMVPKRHIRYLNTSALKVRRALCERGENWRMARHPISQEDMVELIERSRVPVGELPIYYYNHSTGTRFLTASTYAAVSALDDAAYVRQIAEIVRGMNKVNRFGHPEIDVFPTTTPIEVRKGLKMLKVEELSAAELRRAVGRIETTWRMAQPPELREESVDNYDWRNEMCHVLTVSPNETNAEEQELIAGIAPEFYRQIEWLPGARIDRGELIFDPEVSDNREKSFIFNAMRLFGSIEFINIGRIAKSLARHPVDSNRRGDVYIMQYREHGEIEPKIKMVRLQKWGVAERLDEGKDLLQAIVETDEYSDYILDRRLMCRQLGMNLPLRLEYGHFTERYCGDNAKYDGWAVRATYFLRDYVPGIASDKVPPVRFRNPAFAAAFATLMGEAAAIDLVVGRRNSVTGQCEFDQNYEVVIVGEDGLPVEIKVTDHAGSFGDYDGKLDDIVGDYAAVIRRRRDFVSDYPLFASAYVSGFERKLREVQAAYRERRRAFDQLFSDRPYDTKGSGAYRWASALRRLDACDPAKLAAKLKVAISI